MVKTRSVAMAMSPMVMGKVPRVMKTASLLLVGVVVRKLPRLNHRPRMRESQMPVRKVATSVPRVILVPPTSIQLLILTMTMMTKTVNRMMIWI
jgi:hypothetical protein